jgi:hypothetical protein
MSARDMDGFDANGYRKRVLAAVLARGGPEASDPFELYDLPPDDDLPDAAVAARVAEVWGAWQRQRDHPKYRVLVAQLVEGHDARSAELLDGARRRTAAARVRAQREQRDTARYALLDAAVSRLVARHGGVPADKVEGLHEVGALGGLSPAEVEVRLRRHRVLAPAGPAGPAVPPERRRQVRALLDEFARLSDGPAPATLLALLDAGAASGREEIAARAAAWRSRARELPPTRLRTVVDELLVHVAELLEPGRAAVDAYLDAVALDVAEHVRPRMRAAVLVEDRLLAEDHAHLLDTAVELGLDRPRALALLAAVAAELGTTIEDAPAVPAAPPPPRDRPWEEPLRAARAALRAGRPRAAAEHVARARRLAGADGARPVRAVADEVDAVLAEATRRARAARAAVAARRWSEVCEHLGHVARTAADVPDPDAAELLDRARREVAAADAALAAALAGPASARAAALAVVLDACPGHPGATEALAALPLPGPARVRAARDASGDVLVVWEPPPGVAGAVYRVARLTPDGQRRVVGRVPDTCVLDGGAPPGVEPPVYAVEVLVGGRASAPTRSDAGRRCRRRRPEVVPRPGRAPRRARDVLRERATRRIGGGVAVRALRERSSGCAAGRATPTAGGGSSGARAPGGCPTAGAPPGRALRPQHRSARRSTACRSADGGYDLISQLRGQPPASGSRTATVAEESGRSGHRSVRHSAGTRGTGTPGT